MAEYVGRSAHGFDNMVALAETVGAPVIDINSRLNFPSNHPLNLSMDQTVFGDRDVILNLDVRDWERPATKLDSTNRSVEHLVPESCEWMDIGFAELGLSKWSMDYQRMQNFSLRILADTATAIPALTEICRERIKGDSKLKRTIGERSAAVAVRHDEPRASWRRARQPDSG